MTKTVTKRKKGSNTQAAGQTEAKRPSSTGRKVYSIYRWNERFEMEDYIRQGGLDFVRMFVTATTQKQSNESTDFFQQLSELRHFYPDKFYFLFGIFWTLVSLTATRECWLRGFLLDGGLTPLTQSKLAARLQINLKETKAALAALIKVGLIEYIDCPEFSKPVREKKEEQSQKQGKSKQSYKKKSKSVTSKKAAIRKHSETFPNVSESLNNKNGIKTEINSNLKNKKTDLNETVNQNPIETNANQNSNQVPEANESLEPESTEQTENLKSKVQKQKKALLQNKTHNSGKKPVNPSNPKESEAAAVSTHYVPKQPSSAFRGGKIISIGDVLVKRFPEHWQDQDAEAFGWEMVEALGYSTDRNNEHSRAEWGAFAKWWVNVKNTLRTQLHSELWDIAIKKAKYVNSPKAKSARNKSAVWFKIMRGELLSRGIALPYSRASPAFNVNRCKVDRSR